MYVVYCKETVEEDIVRLVEILTRDEIGEREENYTREHARDQVRKANRNLESFAAFCVFPVRSGLEELGEEGNDCEQEAEDYQGNVDPETNPVVLCVRDGAGRSGGVLGKQQVGDSVKNARSSVTGLR